ncbi:MAG: PASTA domain-containing protein [Prevotella sp.]|nr:PASTA domain-containing protein [Prevotella sp.]
MNTKEFFGKFTSGYLLAHLAAMAVAVVLLCVGVWYGLRVYTHHGEGVNSPDLKGMNSTEARRLLLMNGLQMEVNDTGYNKRMPADCVLAQMPAAGQTVKTGRTIFVTINSLNSPRVSLPDLIDNSSYRQARAKLEAMGFRVLEPKYIDGEKDWVLGIQMGGRNLQTGDMVPTESALTIVIGKGYENDEYEEEDDTMELFDDGSDDVDDFLEVPDMTETEDD